MKISGINQIVSINFDKKINQKKNIQSPISKGMVDLANNSLAEVIGRSQVSFKGESSLSGNILQYQNISKLTGKSESFTYNKEDGSIEHEEYTSGNVLKKKYKFNPSNGFEQITLLQPDGTTTIETKEPDLYKFERFDEEGNPLYREESDDDSEESKLNKITVTYEYGDKAREIIRRYKNGKVSEVEVIDSRTGDVVTEGRLLESKFKQKDGWIVTKNIVNGDIYERELKDQYGNRQQYKEYSRKTLALIHEFTTDKKTGETAETKYTEDGKHILFTEKKSSSGNVLYKAVYSPNTLKKISEESYDISTGDRSTKEYTEDGIIVKYTLVQKNGTTEVTDYDENGKIKTVIVTSKNKREVDEYKYSPEGEIISDIHYEYNRKGSLQEKTVYVPNSGIIKTRTEYKNESTYTQYEYNTSSSREEDNIPVSSETYEHGVLISEQRYHADGETISDEIVYGKDRFFIYSKYDEDGYILERTHCTDKATPYEYEKYNENGIVIKRVKDINSMNLRETTLYDERTGNQTKFSRRTKDGKPLLQLEYYPNGKAIKIEREFNADGSFTRTEYDEYGNVTSQTKHPAKNETTQRTTKQNPVELSPEEKDKIQLKHLKSLGDKVKSLSPPDTSKEEIEAYKREGIIFTPAQATREEIETMLEITGIENPSTLFALNKKQYRTYAFNFHPDRNGGKTEIEQKKAELVFQILNALYSDSPNEGV